MAVILVTGTSSGIGAAVATRFAKAGWTVIATLRDPSRPGPAEGLPEGVIIEQLDLADPASVTDLAQRVIGAYGVPDVLVNNASTLEFGSVEDTSADKIAALFQVNVLSQIELIKAFVPAMRERGCGVIVNVTSLGGRMTFPFFAVYNASKHAMEGFSEGLWHELKPFGIRVKAVEPGFVDTPIWRTVMCNEDGSARCGSEPYRPFQEAMVRFEKSITRRTPPADAAEEIWRVVNDPSDRLRYPISAYARPLIAARRWLGERTVMRFLHRQFMGE